VKTIVLVSIVAKSVLNVRSIVMSNHNYVISELQAWIEDEPAETMALFIELDGRDYSLQDLLIEVQNNTEIGQAFVLCYDDVIAGKI
jgi:hypothetical protein